MGGKVTITKVQKAIDDIDRWRKWFGDELGDTKLRLGKMLRTRPANIDSLREDAEDVAANLHGLGTTRKLLGEKIDALIKSLEAADKGVSADKRGELHAILQKVGRMKKGAITVTGQVSARLGKLSDDMYDFSQMSNTNATAAADAVKGRISKKYLKLIDTGIKAMDVVLVKDLQSVDKRLDYVFVKGSGQLFGKQKEVLDLLNKLSKVGTGIARARNMIESGLKPLEKLRGGKVATVDTKRLHRDVRALRKAAEEYLAQSEILRRTMDEIGPLVTLSQSKTMSGLVTLAGHNLRHAITLKKELSLHISSGNAELEKRLLKWSKAAGETESKKQLSALKQSDAALKRVLNDTEKELIETDKLLKEINAEVRKLN